MARRSSVVLISMEAIPANLPFAGALGAGVLLRFTGGLLARG
jgi:hypothetical protein